MKIIVAILVAAVGAASALPSTYNTDLAAGTLISNGTEATKGEFPNIVQIKANGTHRCAGSILSPDTVVTSGQCVIRGSMSEYTLVAGEHNLNENEGTEQTRSISQIIYHPRYNSGSFDNDVTILKVSPPFNVGNGSGVEAAVIPASGYAVPNEMMLAGWGAQTYGGNTSTVLMKVGVSPRVSDRVCRSSAVGDTLSPGMLCAGTLEQGPCEGDGGDPLMYNTTLVGFVSFRHSCGNGVVSVYTEVSYFSDWILSQL